MAKKHTILALLGAAALLTATLAAAKNFPHEDHVKDYAGGDCFACHSAKDKTIVPNLEKCADCHEKDFVKGVSFPALKSHGLTWSLNHGPSAKADQGKCLVCHNEGKGPIGCSECHATLSPSEAATLSSGMLNVHRGEFKVTHPLAARANAKACGSCHQTSFCNECHDSYKPEELANPSHRARWSTLLTGRGPHSAETGATCVDCHGPNKILPDRHTWTDDHARDARKNLATCQACHPDGDVCLTCHSAKSGLGMNPHPKNWDKTAKGRLDSASGGKTCKKCH